LNDLRGAHVWILANGSIVWRISVRVEGWKSSGARRFCADVSWYGRQSDWHAHTVMMSVFEGGDGSTSGGKSERSRESGDLLRDDALERCGDGMVACMFAIM
jgi:hypothetical protein